MLKRTIDVVVALVGLILFSPLFIVLSIVIKLDSAGPVYYRASRVGKGGRRFHMYKFRTMVADADRTGPALTYKDDPRITKVGTVLRRARLDELPQLLNVLRGNMSIVGPRPETPHFVQKYSPEQREILRVRPGMTGLAQIAFRHEQEALSNPETLDDEYMKVILPPKLALDMKYIEQECLGLDIQILLQTVWVLIADLMRRQS